MPQRSSSWMDEVGNSVPRRPSASGPLLPYVIGTSRTFTNHRSYSFSGGENQSLRTFGNNSSGTAPGAIAEEAISDEPQLPSPTTYMAATRRLSTPLTGRNPWHPIQAAQQSYFVDNDPSTARAFLPSSPTSLSMLKEAPITYETIARPTSRDITPKLDSTEWFQQNSFAQPSPFQEIQYIPPRIRPTSRGISRAETWDPRMGNRGPRDWELHPVMVIHYAVIEFKAHRSDVYYYHKSDGMNVAVGSYVIVDADRGHDLGKTMFTTEVLSEAYEVKRALNRENYNTLLQASRIGRPPGWNSEQSFNSYHDFNTNCSFASGFLPTEGHTSVTKAIKRLALDHEIQQLEYKTEREETAKRLCILAVQRHGLHLHEMEILEAEFQYDWGKLTFYFLSPQYLHFNPLVTELFKLFKTRIWMSALNPASCVAPSPQQMLRGSPSWSEHPIHSSTPSSMDLQV